MPAFLPVARAPVDAANSSREGRRMPDPSRSQSLDFQIFLSSTVDDLVEERKAAIEILRGHGRVVDSYRAGPRPTVENCLADVRSS